MCRELRPRRPPAIDSFICVRWLVHVCDLTCSLCNMIRSCVWHDSFMCLTNSFMRVIWLIHGCDVIHSCVWNNSIMSHCITLQHTALHCNTPAILCVLWRRSDSWWRCIWCRGATATNPRNILQHTITHLPFVACGGADLIVGRGVFGVAIGHVTMLLFHALSYVRVRQPDSALQPTHEILWIHINHISMTHVPYSPTLPTSTLMKSFNTYEWDMNESCPPSPDSTPSRPSHVPHSPTLFNSLIMKTCEGMWHDTFIYATWLILKPYICHTAVLKFPFLCPSAEARLYMPQTHSYVFMGSHEWTGGSWVG